MRSPVACHQIRNTLDTYLTMKSDESADCAVLCLAMADNLGDADARHTVGTAVMEASKSLKQSSRRRKTSQP
jgi:hypothetical protein